MTMTISTLQMTSKAAFDIVNNFLKLSFTGPLCLAGCPVLALSLSLFLGGPLFYLLLEVSFPNL